MKGLFLLNGYFVILPQQYKSIPIFMFLKKIDQHLLDAIEEFGFTKPTKLQKSCFSKIKSGIDLLIDAPEKSGKTTAITIGVIQQLKEEFEDVPRALIIVANKEKAIAMKEQFNALGSNTNLRVFCAVEGGDILILRDRIYAGSDVVIGTAKRLNELYSCSGINLNNLKMFIIDDAELILRDQILSDINRLSPYIPKSQRIVFTKGISNRLENYMEKFMHSPEILHFEE